MKKPNGNLVWQAVLFVQVALVSCTPKLNKEEYVKWVQDYNHGLHVKKSYDQFVFDLQYEPVEYLMLQRGEQNNAASTQAKESEIQHYVLTVGMQNPTEDLMKFGVHNVNEHQRKLYFFSYSFQNDILIEENGKELPCVLYHFEKSADLKKYYTFVLGFENPNKESKESIFVIKSDMFSSLPIKIKISKDNIPTLEI